MRDANKIRNKSKLHTSSTSFPPIVSLIYIYKRPGNNHINYTNQTPVKLRLTKERRRYRSPSSGGGAVAAYYVAGEVWTARPVAVTYCAAVVAADDGHRDGGCHGALGH